MKPPSKEHEKMPLSKPKGGLQYGKDSDYIQSITSIFSEDRVFENRKETRVGESFQRIQKLESFRLDAVLSARRSGNLHRIVMLPRKVASSGCGCGSQQVDVVLCPQAPTGGHVRGSVNEHARGIPVTRGTRSSGTQAHHLSKSEQPWLRRRLQGACERPTYKEATRS